MSNKQTGTVKWFDNAKGFGFLISENVTEDVFVHYRSILVDGYKTLREGQVVEFLLTRGEKGYQAAEVVPVVGGVAA
jgi:CspA family cold shock protein